MTSGAAALLRDPGGSQRVTLLELFFDLVFVAALAVTSMTLAEDVSWTNGLQTVISLIAVWWVWSITAIVTDFYDPRRTPIQILLIGVMLGTVMMAVAIPGSFDGRGVLFASAYVGIHIGRGILLIAVLRRHEARIRATRFLFWFCVSGVPWMVGAFQDATTQAILWGIALAIDLVANGLRYPVPVWGRVPLWQYRRAGEHIGERYQQFMILALGDLILVGVLGYSRLPSSAAGLASVLVTFAITVLVWETYVLRAGALLLSSVIRRPGRAVRWAPFTHLIMVLGTVFTATGTELMISEPVGHTPPSWLAFLVGGPVLFLVGRLTFEYQVFGRLPLIRLMWPALLLAITPGLAQVKPVDVGGVVVAIFTFMVVTDAVRTRRRRVPTTIHLQVPDNRETRRD